MHCSPVADVIAVYLKGGKYLMTCDQGKDLSSRSYVLDKKNCIAFSVFFDMEIFSLDLPTTKKLEFAFT